jgi:hypothetical protein
VAVVWCGVVVRAHLAGGGSAIFFSSQVSQLSAETPGLSDIWYLGRGTPLSLYSPVHAVFIVSVYFIIFFSLCARACTLGGRGTRAVPGMHVWVFNAAMPLSVVSLTFGGLWSYYNEFSRSFWGWDYVELLFLDIFWVVGLPLHALFLCPQSGMLFLPGAVYLLLVSFFRLSQLESTHHLLDGGSTCPGFDVPACVSSWFSYPGVARLSVVFLVSLLLVGTAARLPYRVVRPRFARGLHIGQLSPTF